MKKNITFILYMLLVSGYMHRPTEHRFTYMAIMTMTRNGKTGRVFLLVNAL
jgi:hypothetical protein